MKLSYALGAIAPLAVAAAPSFAGTTVLASWEQTPDNFTHVNPFSYSDSIGVTHGDYSLALQVPDTYSQSFRDGTVTPERRAHVLNNDVISIDLTKLEGGDVALGGGNLSLQYHILGGNGINGSFSMLSDTVIYSDAGDYTFSWDYRTAFGGTLPPEDGGGYMQIRLYTNSPNSVYAPTIYFDNLRVSSPDERLAGDANNDGTVDVADLGILANNFRMDVTGGMDEADFNEDGTVDVTDLGILADNFRSSIGDPELAELLVAYNLGAYVSAIPEPTSIAALGAAGLLLGRRRRA